MKAYLLLCVVALCGCAMLPTPAPTATPEPTPKPALSSTSQRLYERLVEEGTLLDEMTENGVNFRDFSQQFAKYESVHTMIFEVSNNALKRELVLEMDKVVAGWGGAQTLWDWKVNDLDPPTEGDERFKWVQEYVPAKLIEYGKQTGLASKSKQYIKHGDAIRAVLTTASGHFHKVRTEILKILAKQGE